MLPLRYGGVRIAGYEQQGDMEMTVQDVQNMMLGLTVGALIGCVIVIALIKTKLMDKFFDWLDK